MLAQRITVNDVANLVLTGHACNTSQCETNIKCQGTSGLELQNIGIINITGIEFSGCGGEQINGGALTVSNVTSLSILNCSFIGNGVFGVRAFGGAVYIDAAFDVSIFDSYFINNSARCNYNEDQSCDSALSAGGAIYISDNRKFNLIYSHFEQNSAYNVGGVIASFRSTIVVARTMFVHNQVHSDTYGHGGAIYAELSTLVISSNQYTSNIAQMYGGAISVSDSLLYLSYCHFTNNTAYIAGGAIVVIKDGRLTSSGNFYNSNAARYGGAVFISRSSLAEATGYYGNNNADSGGALYVQEGNMFSSGNYYTSNTGIFGGAIYLIRSDMSSNSSHHMQNSATNGGALYISGGILSLANGSYVDNKALKGGAICVINGSISTSDCDFENNSADYGGVVYAEDGNVTSNNSWYEMNKAALYGGAICSFATNGSSSKTADKSEVIKYSLQILSTNFTNNEARHGGGIFVSALGSVSVSGSDCKHNHATDGGAFYIEESPTFCIHNNFTNNSAENGGAIYVTKSSMTTISSYYDQNSALQKGGAIFVIGRNGSTSNNHYTNISADSLCGASCGNTSSISDIDCVYSNNSAEVGGVIYMESSNISSVGSYYEKNQANAFGGVIVTVNANISISECYFSDNQAESCAVVYVQNSSIYTNSCLYSNNRATLEGGVMSTYASSIKSVGSYYSSNSAQYGGVFSISHSSLQTSQSYYTNNTAIQGGAIFADMANVSISGGICSYNQAETGAVVYVKNSSIYSTSCLYSNNRATLAGGVMYVYTSSVTSLDSYYSSNSAPDGGAIFTLQSSLQTSQSYYTNNTANQGGAIHCTCTEQSHVCSTVSIGNYYISNSVSKLGGAYVSSEMCNGTATNDHYYYNYAEVGGAMGLQYGSLTISGSSFSNNNAGVAGGAIQTVHFSLTVSSTNFMNNRAASGGALHCTTSSFAMLHSNFTSNLAQLDGGAVFVGSGISVTCSNSSFVSNIALLNAGAIKVNYGEFASTGCHFKNNQARYHGGAIRVGYGNVFSVNSVYSNNVAGSLAGGAITVDKGSVSSSGSNYTGNLGGAISIYTEGSIFSSDSCYVNNTSKAGGAIFVNEGIVYSTRSQYLNNSATQYGGAIHVNIKGNVSCVNSSFKYNRALTGGAIFAWTDTVVTSSGCLYEDNIASRSGGAICTLKGAITSSNTNYINNYSDFGGALFVFGGIISNMQSNFAANKANRAGGAICALLSNISSGDSHFENNNAYEYGGAIYTDSCTLNNSLLFFQHNADDKLLLASAKSICTSSDDDVRPGFNSTKIELSGGTTFTNNTCGLVGGAIISIQVGVFFNGTVPAVVGNNVAIYGGGLALVGSTMNIHSPIKIQDNEATLSGGGILSYLSDIRLSSPENTNVVGNTVSQNGGGVYAVDSYIEITRGIMHFENNAASKGAAVSLEQNSKIHLLKERQETVAEYNMKLEFINNHAQYGGAVHISDSSEDISACGRGVPGTGLALSSQECFIQTILLNITDTDDNTKTDYINVFFMNNTASVSGGAIYGGLLDRCVLNRSAELVTQFPEYQRSTGFDYIRATAQFAGLVDYDNLTSNYSPDKLINAITSTNVEGLISSEPVQVCFCLENVHNCSYDHPNVFTKKGELFRLSVIAVDQVGNPINATVISSFVSNNGDLNVDQARQETSTHCTELEYNVYPKGDSSSSQIEIYAEGPCSDIGISKRILNVTFLPCTCPIGFQPIETESLCTCDCDPILRPAYILNCSYADETVLRDSNPWINYVNATTGAGYLLYPDCPFDYCVDKPVNVNLNIPNGADVQCAFNRSGKLCGACKNNLSLMMGTSRCQECSNSFISLIIPFALAGIALVAFILILNVTVATGTIHGLIFYANILVASRSIFIPLDTPNILTVFISWINLDLGIETCFYNGMDSYTKVLLQLAFPTYIILITITIIIISEYSIRFATLIGKKDPVATLCTLILLSYSKLIRTIIASLQFTYLDYPDGSSEIVWLYDANVPYFTPSHIPRFITAIVIIIFGSVYTVLIFFGQWIPRCGNNKLIRWVNNPKYNEFIKKYHVPFNPKHRYWVGLLLLARIFHYLVSSFVPDAAVLLSVICIVVGLVLLKLMITVMMKTSTYNNWLVETFEITFLINLVIFTAATYYVGDNGGNQIALAATSLGISFIAFLGILVYHCYMYILKDTWVWIRMKQLLQRIVPHCDRRQNFDLVPLEDQENDNEQDEQMIEMQPPYTDDNDTDPIDLPHHYDPPVIVPAVRYDQPREPALDILDPITTDDYRQLNQPPAPRPRQVPTTTVIDFVRPHRNVDSVDHP